MAAIVGFVIGGLLILVMGANAGVNDWVRERRASRRGDTMEQLSVEAPMRAPRAHAHRAVAPRRAAPERPRPTNACFHPRTGALVGATSREFTVADAERDMTETLREAGVFRSSDRARCREFHGTFTPEEIAANDRVRAEEQRVWGQHAAQHRRTEHRSDYGGTFYCAVEGEYVGTAPGASNASETASWVQNRLRARGQPVDYADLECCGSYRSKTDYFRDHPDVHHE